MIQDPIIPTSITTTERTKESKRKLVSINIAFSIIIFVLIAALIAYFIKKKILRPTNSRLGNYSSRDNQSVDSPPPYSPYDQRPMWENELSSTIHGNNVHS